MDARNTRPGMGSLIVCSFVWLTSSSLTLAQFAPAYYGPSAGQPMVMGAPAMMPGRLVGQGQPMRMGAGSATSADPASRVPTLPFNESTAVSAAGHSASAPAASNNGQSENFIVLCRDPQLAAQVSAAAEKYRRELAVYWLGEELPPWSRRCPIQVTSGPKLGAGGETRFTLYDGNVGDWQMSVQGTPQRILDSVLPHEITHTLLASHFAPLNVHVPRWADEGACTTVEHDSEQNKHKHMLVNFMQSGRALSFNRMFTLKDYPSDILPLYAQGHSVVEFLIEQGGPREFVSFLEQGMRSRSWEAAVRDHYGYETLGKLQIQWNKWIADGRGDVEKFAGRALSDRPGATPKDPPSLAQAKPNTGKLELPEGSRVELAGFKNVSSDSDKPGEITLVSGDAESLKTPAKANAKPEDVDGGFYRKRLESSLRAIDRDAPVLR